jgi:hypothetical protein
MEARNGRVNLRRNGGKEKEGMGELAPGDSVYRSVVIAL